MSDEKTDFYDEELKPKQPGEELTGIEIMKRRYVNYVKTLKRKPKASIVFEAGALAIRRHLEYWISNQLRGERGDAFSLGQDDGLRWVLDELEALFNETSIFADDSGPASETV